MTAAELDEAALRVGLSRLILSEIERKQIGLPAIAKLFGVSRSQLGSMEVHRLPVWTMLNALTKIGSDVEIRIEPRRKRGPGRIAVTTPSPAPPGAERPNPKGPASS